MEKVYYNRIKQEEERHEDSDKDEAFKMGS